MSETPSRYTVALIGMTASLALAAPLAAQIGDAKVTSVRDAAGLVLDAKERVLTGQQHGLRSPAAD